MKSFAVRIILVLCTVEISMHCKADDRIESSAREIATATLKEKIETQFDKFDEIEYAVGQTTATQAVVVIWCSTAPQFLVAVVNLPESRVDKVYLLGDEDGFSVERIHFLKSKFEGGFVGWYQANKIRFLRFDELGAKKSLFVCPFKSMRFALAELTETEIVLVNNLDQNIKAHRILYNQLEAGIVNVPPETVAKDALLQSNVAVSVHDNIGACAWLSSRLMENGKVDWATCDICVSLLRFTEDETSFEEPRKIGTLPMPRYWSPQGDLQIEIVVKDGLTKTRTKWKPADEQTIPATIETSW